MSMAESKQELAPSISSSRLKQRLETVPAGSARASSWDAINGCVSPAGGHQLLSQRRYGRHRRSTKGGARLWIAKHQKALFSVLLLLHAFVHVGFPQVRQHTLSFVRLSYYDGKSQNYGRGFADVYYIVYWIILFSALRAFTMDYALMPITKGLGILKTKTRVRFAEQAWMLMYYGVLWPFGMYLMYRSKYWLNLREMWTDFPTRSIDGPMKWYYLVQCSFWLQQILVINLEERRKDHWQMFTHHIITILLISMSYGYYHTNVGNVILCIMDQVDLVLSTAKMLKYAGYQTACDVAFGIFILSWFATRHVCYLTICWSIWVDVPEKIPYGCYSSLSGVYIAPQEAQDVASRQRGKGNEVLSNLLHAFVEPEAPVCFNKSIHYTFLGLLLFLQGLTIMWFVLILRIAWRVVKGDGADDTRSDDEEEVEGEEAIILATEKEARISMQPVEEFVGVEALNLKRRASPLFRNRKAPSHTGGITISGHSDRKELLGRIGCDKPS